MPTREEDCAPNCSLGNPAPRGAGYVWHTDLESIPGGKRCMQCGELFLTKKAKAIARVHLQALRDLGIECRIVGSAH